MSDIRNMQYNPEEFCSTRDAAGILGVSLRTVQLWVESGALQAWKTAGGHRRITMKSVEKLVRERQRSSAPRAYSKSPVDDRFEVLIAEHDENQLKLSETVMSGWNLPLKISKARDGFEALVKIGKSKPDLLISDLSLPGMDGFRMIQTLRNTDGYRDMAIIIVTGLDPESIRAVGLPSDIPVMTKPVSFPQLFEAVSKFCQPK